MVGLLSGFTGVTLGGRRIFLGLWSGIETLCLDLEIKLEGDKEEHLWGVWVTLFGVFNRGDL